MNLLALAVLQAKDEYSGYDITCFACESAPQQTAKRFVVYELALCQHGANFIFGG